MASKLDKPMSFKASVLEAFHRLGGVDSMVMWAAHNPTEFYKIAARLIPQELSGGDGEAVRIIVNKISIHADTPALVPTPRVTPASAVTLEHPALPPALADLLS